MSAPDPTAFDFGCNDTSDLAPCADLSDLCSGPEADLARSVAERITAERDSIPREQRIAQAAQETVARKARRSNPAGSFDRWGRWYPAPEEKCPDCSAIRTPSKRWPYTLLLHCRTAQHVAARAGLSSVEVKRAARAMQRNG